MLKNKKQKNISSKSLEKCKTIYWFICKLILSWGLNESHFLISATWIILDGLNAAVNLESGIPNWPQWSTAELHNVLQCALWGKKTWQIKNKWIICETLLHVYSVILAWCSEHAGSHLSTLCDEDGELGLVVGSCRSILLGRRSTHLKRHTRPLNSHVNITPTTLMHRNQWSNTY